MQSELLGRSARAQLCFLVLTAIRNEDPERSNLGEQEGVGCETPASCICNAEA